MILYLIRHGESEFNAEGRIQGQLDPPLSPKGRRQGEAVAEALAACSLEAVYSSPLQRAWETARPLAERLDKRLLPLEELMELNAGIFQGLTWPEIHDRHPKEAASWAAHDPDFRIPGGESRRDLMVRGRAVLQSIRKRHQRAVAVISHGAILAGALKALLGVPAELNPFSFFNASISQLGWDGPVKLWTFNETDHLRQMQGDLATHGGDL